MARHGIETLAGEVLFGAGLFPATSDGGFLGVSESTGAIFRRTMFLKIFAVDIEGIGRRDTDGR